MKRLWMAVLGLIAITASGPSAGQAGEPAYAVTFIEVAPGSTAAAAKLLRDYDQAVSSAPDIIAFTALQQLGRDSHFALVQVSTDAKALVARSSSGPAVALRAALQPLLIAPYDERPHSALAVSPPDAASYAGELVILTHIDVIPTAKAEGVDLVVDFVGASRGQPGASRFDGLTQSNRPNHMTMVQVWRGAPDFEASILTDRSKTFRDRFLPLSGSLYDERLYRALE